MNYIVFDLENNCSFRFNRITRQLEKGNSNRICPNEIIELGAVKLNADLDIIDSFKMYIKPRLYKRINPKIKKKTRITEDKLKHAFPFKQAINDFINWIGSEYLLCCWGKDDILTLKRNCKYHNLDCEWVGNYIDIQYSITEYFNYPHQIGLKNALTEFNIAVEGQLHDALNDAEYTAKIIKVSKCIK